MDECRDERKEQKRGQARKKREDQRIKVKQGRGVWQRKFRSTWGQRVQEREKWWRDSDVATWREKIDIEWKERKEGVECPIKWSTKNVYPDCLKIIDFGKTNYFPRSTLLSVLLFYRRQNSKT
jgi:hypothetical protein